MQRGVTSDVAESMVERRMNDFKWKLSLLSQCHIMYKWGTVGDILRAAGVEVTGFERFEVGEGIQTLESDFAYDEAAMVS